MKELPADIELPSEYISNIEYCMKQLYETIFIQTMKLHVCATLSFWLINKFT